jgi:hypothetical protein
MGGTRSMHGEMRNEYNILVGKLKRRERLGRQHGGEEEAL